MSTAEVDAAIKLHSVPAKALPPKGNTTDTIQNHLILGKKSISKLGLLSVYMIKNDKVLPFIFIKGQKAEQNNLLLSSARLICLAKPGGGRKGGWKAVATPCLHYPQVVPPWEEMLRVVCCRKHFLISSLRPASPDGWVSVLLHSKEMLAGCP